MLYIQKLMKERFLSIRALARAVDYSPASVCQVVNATYRGGNGKLVHHIEAALRSLGVKEEEIDRLWEILPDDPQPARVMDFESLKTHTQEDAIMSRGLSQDVLRHFGLFRDPFSHPETRDEVVRTHNLKMAESAIVDAAEKHQFVALIGETGTGKTTARDSALDRLAKKGTVHIIYIEPIISYRLTAPMICTCILRELNEPVPSEMIQRTATMRRVLKVIMERGENVLLVIEEAHLLHPSTLRSLKHLYEIQSGFVKLIGILLIGQTGLEGKFKGTDMDEVTSRCRTVRLMDMSLAEIGEYLNCRMQAVRGDGGAGTVFSPEAVSWIAARAKVPQKINNVARELLTRAYELGSKEISRDVLTA